MKQILILTDFSKCSFSALECGVTWASKTGAVVHVYHKTHELDAGAEPIVVADLNELDTSFKDIEGALRKTEEIIHAAGLEEKFVLGGLGVSDFVAQYVRSESIDVVFMGSRGVHKTKEDELGSNALSVLMNAETAVVVTKEEVESFDLHHVVFASDYNSEAKAVFNKVLDFVRPFEPEIHLLTIDVPKFFNATKFIMKEAMRDFADMATGFKTSSHLYKNSKVGHGIVDFCNDMDADLIAFSESGRSVFGNARFARPVGYLVQYARQPVLFAGNSKNPTS